MADTLPASDTAKDPGSDAVGSVVGDTAADPMRMRRPALDFPVVAIGASAGGLEAVQTFLSSGGAQPGLAFVLVQHLDPNHASMLADLLSRRTDMQVRQIEDGDTLAPDTLFVIPPGFALGMDGATLRLEAFEEPRGLRRPIDDFFSSVAAAHGPNAACVILSGTGADGTAGLRAIKEAGGLVLVQEPDEARYDGMPTSALATGLVDRTGEAGRLLPMLREYFNGELSVGVVDDVLESLDEVADVMSHTVGHDFSGYKQATMMRRIRRRMQLLGISAAREYVELLRKDTAECHSLLTDLLINVTCFFRDPQAFTTLEEEVLAPLVERSGRSDTLRIWVPGCSSGEEPFTLAMIIAKLLEGKENRPYVQIFATDIDEQMLQTAKEVRYPVTALGDIPERYHDYCNIQSAGFFTLTPFVRDMVRFSPHSLIKDPPFSRLDLISCRNLLIYLGTRLQAGVLPLFHYALKPGGTLFLGSAETVGQRNDLFETVDKSHRIYARKAGRTPEALSLPLGAMRRSSTSRRMASQSAKVQSGGFTTGLVERRLLDAYTPTHLVVSETGEILESSGQLAKYFDFPPGAPTRHVASLARGGLREALSRGLNVAAEKRRRSVQRKVEITSPFGMQSADVVVDPLPNGSTLVVIRSVEDFRIATEEDLFEDSDFDEVQTSLEEELDSARVQLRTTVEELETTNEELKSSNEEMMSMNEELQSANEELTTVNDELKTKIDKLAEANDDQQNFLVSSDLALLVLDADLNIRMFTDATQDVFPLVASDVGRSLSAFVPNLSGVDVAEVSREVMDTGAVRALTVTSRDGDAIYAMRVLPYRAADRSVQGVTLTFADVTELREAKAESERTGERLELALRATKVGVWEADLESGEAVLDSRVRALFGLPKSGALTVERAMGNIHADDADAVNAAFERAVDERGEFRMEFRIKDTDPVRWIAGVGSIVDDADGTPRMIGVNYDISELKEAERQQGLLVRELDHRVKNLFAVMLGMLRAEGRRTDDCSTLIGNVEARLGSLARAHDASRGTEARDVLEMGMLLREVLSPYGVGERVVLEGDPTTLPVQYTTPLGLVLHELATNAQKHGALSVDGGRVHIGWTLDDDGKLHLRWRESGGPEVSEPSRTGFGFRLVNQSLAQLRATSELDWDPKGFTLAMVLPTHQS